MSWTKEEMSKVYQEVQKKAMTDEEFRTELLENPNAVIEKLTGKELPEGMRFHVIESDPAYTATFVLPDLVGDEIEESELDNVAGGISFLLVASACAAAISFGPCPADACAAMIGK